jgi:hypothetical protein
MVNYDDYTAAGYDPQARQAKIRQLGYTGEFGGGQADNWLKSNYGGTKVANLSNTGVRPLTKASMNDYQKTSLYDMGRQSTEVDPNIKKMYGQAGTAINAIGAKYDPNSYKQFMNPYIDEVINRNASTIGRTYDARRNDINQGFAEAGGYGSTAQGVERNLNTEAQARQIGDMDAQLRASGYDSATQNALGLFNGDRAAAQTQASLYQGLGNAYGTQDEYTRNVIRNALMDKMTAGERIQQDQQGELDAYYNEQNREQQYTPQQLALLGQLLGYYPTGTTSTSSTSGAGGLQQMLGGALMGSSMYSDYSKNSGSSALPWQSAGNVNPLGGFY